MTKSKKPSAGGEEQESLSLKSNIEVLREPGTDTRDQNVEDHAWLFLKQLSELPALSGIDLSTAEAAKESISLLDERLEDLSRRQDTLHKLRSLLIKEKLENAK